MQTLIELINFVDLTVEEKMKVLSWRNSESIRKWMYNNEIISKESHFEFIEKLTLIKDKLYFLVKEKEEYIGVIDFVNIENKSAHMGVYANPELKGNGEKLIDTIIFFGFNTLMLEKIIAEVYCLNKKAINLYKKKGFREFSKKSFNNQEMICMELYNENR